MTNTHRVSRTPLANATRRADLAETYAAKLRNDRDLLLTTLRQIDAELEAGDVKAGSVGRLAKIKALVEAGLDLTK